ncbi:MAG TPA: helix-turn-helix transcriptional regulator [Pseudomonadales bacterium]|nr:helix-turn-helix transcriptional regulator [Pseudomonadales bacterium]
MKIGAVIKKTRLALGETLEEVAHRAGMDASNLSRIERDVQQPSAALIQRIADALGIPAGKLFETQTTPDVPAEIKQERKDYNRQSQHALRHFRDLNPDNQQLALDFLKLLNRHQLKTES